MATRKQVHEHFGPKLIEAINLVELDEINIIRKQLALQPRTGQQFLDAIAAKYAKLDNPLDS